MTRPNITPGPWESSKHATPDYAPQYGLYAGESAYDFALVKGDDAEAMVTAIAALPDLLAALESALDSLQQAVHPLRADGATGAAEDCEDSAALITEALTKAGYTFP